MDGKVCVVTGANSGVGKAMATALAQRGANVVMVARDGPKGEAARADVLKTAARDVLLEIADLSSMKEVRALADRLRARFDRIDVLMNNAGVYLHKRRVTSDGFECSFAVNHLAPFLLTNLLRDRLAVSRSARVVMTSSMAYTSAKLDLDDLMMEKKWKPLRQYANAKLGTVLVAREIARRFKDDGVIANSFHPGGVRSGMAQDEPNPMGTIMWALGPLLRTPEKGADTGLYLATAPETAALSGAFLVDRRPKKLTSAALDEELAQRLWAKSCELTGIDA